MAESGDGLPIVDAHQHFWDLERGDYPWLMGVPPIAFRYGDYGALRRSYGPADYRRDAARHAVVKTVHVEAEWNPADPLGEQAWLAAVREASGLPSVSVAHARLDRDDIEQVLAALTRFPFVRGIRQKPSAAASPRDAARGETGSMDDPRWRHGYGLLERFGFSFDLQTPYWHAEAAAALARDFPRTTIVVNHAFLPVDRSQDGLAAWRKALETVAAEPNVALKISGLGVKGERWSADANRPIVRDAIAIFGVERSLFASNFPVDGLVGSFDTIYRGFKAAVAERPAAEQRKLFHDNAVRLYRIDA